MLADGRRHVSHRRQHRVDAVALEHCDERLARRDAEGEVDEDAVRHSRAQLGGEREDVGADVVAGDRPRGQQRQHGHRRDRGERVADRVEPAVRVHPPARELGKPGQDVGGDHDDRDERQRDQEEDRDRHELVGVRLDAPDLERHSARHGAEQHQPDDHDRVRTAVRRHERHDGAGGDHEGEGKCGSDSPLADRHRLELPFARLADQFL